MTYILYDDTSGLMCSSVGTNGGKLTLLKDSLCVNK